MSKPKVLFVDRDEGGRLTGMDYLLENLDSAFDYEWHPEFNKSGAKLQEHDLSQYFLLIMHPGFEPEYGEKSWCDEPCLANIFAKEVVEKTPYLRYGFVSGVPNVTYSQVLNHQRELQKANLDVHLASRVDFYSQYLPDREELNIKIHQSYQKYAQSVAHSLMHEIGGSESVKA